MPRHKRLYQPPLPWKGEWGPLPAPDGRSNPAVKTSSTTKGHQTAAERPAKAGPIPTARRAVSYGDWRLDEKTRRAGRQGVAAARAALAGTPRPPAGREAHAA